MPSNVKPAKKLEQKKKASVKPKKEAVKKIVKPKKEIVSEVAIEKPEAVENANRYFEAVGRRKTSIARVRLYTNNDRGVIINDKPLEQYFPAKELQEIATSALKKMKCFERFSTIVRVRGGGLHSQAEAIRHGTSRGLVLFNAEFRKRLKRAGYLTRDPRMRERKKFGLKRARRAPQWQKR